MEEYILFPPFPFWILKENFLSEILFLASSDGRIYIFFFSLLNFEREFSVRNSIFSFIWWKNTFSSSSSFFSINNHFMKQILKENFLSEILFLAFKIYIYFFSPSFSSVNNYFMTILKENFLWEILFLALFDGRIHIFFFFAPSFFSVNNYFMKQILKESFLSEILFLALSDERIYIFFFSLFPPSFLLIIIS